MLKFLQLIIFLLFSWILDWFHNPNHPEVPKTMICFMPCMRMAMDPTGVQSPLGGIGPPREGPRARTLGPGPSWGSIARMIIGMIIDVRGRISPKGSIHPKTARRAVPPSLKGWGDSPPGCLFFFFWVNCPCRSRDWRGREQLEREGKGPN